MLLLGGVFMQYRDMITGEKISALGYGCMRLKRDNEEECRRLLTEAVDKGINYFDTAYTYAGNEALVGKILEGELRSRVNIATKLPPNSCSTTGDFDKIFYRQLERLRTNRIDFYLIHWLFDFATWERLCSIGIKEWIARKKQSGEIRHIGFSYHGGFGEFKKMIDDYEWDFCQLQYNYMDEHNQAGITGLNYAWEKNIPIIIMEPLRGGGLTYRLPDDAQALLKSEDVSPARLGLRYVWNHPGVLTVLSGMNEPSQLQENLETAQNALPGSFTPDEQALVEKIRQCFQKGAVVPCTGCGYCMPCPYGVSIPDCFAARNRFSNSKGQKRTLLILNPARHQYTMSTGILSKKPTGASQCRKCGKCEKHCPQGIHIRDALTEVSHTMEPWWFMFPIRLFKKFIK